MRKTGSAGYWYVLVALVLAGCSSWKILPKAPFAEPRATQQLAPTAATAEGLYAYLVKAGFKLSDPVAGPTREQSSKTLVFDLPDGNRKRHLEIDQYPSAAVAKDNFVGGRFTASCGPLVLWSPKTGPTPEIGSRLENTLDLYVARAEHGLITDKGEPVDTVQREPVHAKRKMLAVSRESKIYTSTQPNAEVIQVVHEDELVHVIDMVPDFLKVRLASGREGFIPERAVE